MPHRDRGCPSPRPVLAASVPPVVFASRGVWLPPPGLRSAAPAEPGPETAVWGRSGGYDTISVAASSVQQQRNAAGTCQISAKIIARNRSHFNHHTFILSCPPFTAANLNLDLDGRLSL